MIYPSTDAEFPQVLVDYTHEKRIPRDVSYASLTAPQVVRCDVEVDGQVVDTVWAGAGGSHSWWTPAGGKFLPPDVAPSGLAKGQRLRVIVSGPCALRLDWSPVE